MSANHSESPGLVNTLRAMGDGLLAGVQDRVALLGIELEEEKLRLIRTLVWIGAAIVTGVMVLAMVSFTFIYLLWDRAPVAALVGLSFLYSVLLGAILFGLRRMLMRQPPAFAASLAELEEDRRWIRNDR